MGAAPRTFLSLSPARQRLVRLMSTVGFGRVCDLAVRNGEPAFDPPPLVIRAVKLGGATAAAANRPRPASARANYVLKAAVVDLLDALGRLGDGTVARVEVAHGLPVLIDVREPVPG